MLYFITSMTILYQRIFQIGIKEKKKSQSTEKLCFKSLTAANSHSSNLELVCDNKAKIELKKQKKATR